MEFREFNIGDVVTVVNEPYKGCPFTWVDPMTSMCGETVIITKKRYIDQYNTYCYSIQEDDGNFSWCGNCFFPFGDQAKCRFHIGDRVCASKGRPDGNDSISAGDAGTVCIIGKGGARIGVKWDKNVSGHDCDGRCEYGFGWWVDATSIELDDLSDVDIADDSLLYVIGGGL